MLNNKEKESFVNGNLVIVNEQGIPHIDTKKIYFVWYQIESTQKYKILTKPFNCRKTNVEEYKNKIKTNIKGKVGVGILDIEKQSMKLYKEI